LIERFLEHLRVEEGMSRNTISSYQRELKRFQKWLPNKNWAGLEPGEIPCFLSKLSRAGIGPRSIFHNLAVIRRFYRFLLEEGLVDANPSKFVDSPKFDKRLPECLSQDDAKKMLNAVKDDTRQGIRNRAILELLYGCGLRVSELTGLRLDHLHFELGYIVALSKSKKERAIPINDLAKAAVQKYLQEIRGSYGKSRSGPYLFLNRRGERLSRQSVFKLVKRTALKAGVGGTVSPHTFRHSFAAHLLEGGANLWAVQQMLGNSDNISTTEIHTHLDRQRLRREYDDKHPRSQIRSKK